MKMLDLDGSEVESCGAMEVELIKPAIKPGREVME